MAAAALASLVLPALACTDLEKQARITVERYLAAVMQRDHRTMALLWAPFRLETKGLSGEEREERLAAFQGEIQEAHDGFAKAKESGMLPEDDPLGVAMLRAMRLGKGAFTIPLGAEISEDGSRATVRTRLNTNMDNFQHDSLPTGVLLYVAGYPLGRLERISVGYEELDEKSFLGAVDIMWHLVRPPEGVGTPAGWLIESFAPDPASAVKWERGRR